MVLAISSFPCDAEQFWFLDKDQGQAMYFPFLIQPELAGWTGLMIIIAPWPALAWLLPGESGLGKLLIQVGLVLVLVLLGWG